MTPLDLVLRLRQRPRLAVAGVFGVFFLVLLLLLAAVGVVSVQHTLDEHVSAANRESGAFVHKMEETVDALTAGTNAAPCSEPFVMWLRQVGLRPDGIHEILYTENNVIRCSVTAGRHATPIPLGEPDFNSPISDNIKIWFQRDLEMLGFGSAVATLVSSGNFVLVVPALELAPSVPDDILFESVSPGANGTLWHSAGDHDVYAHATGNPNANPFRNPLPIGFSSHGCDALMVTCIAMHQPLGPVLQRSAPIILGGVLVAALLAGFLTNLTRKSLVRAWSLPSRFRRRLSLETTACQYQPLMDLRSDSIWGVEVLARWRDDDGTLVSPYAFLPTVEKYGLHQKFTRFVVDRAYRDLSALPAGDMPLRVHVNIFPCDFDPDWMLELFADFLADRDRFEVIIELVESDILPIEKTRNAIARLMKFGIKTFIDDFGEGYSSIGYLAGLDAYGVKLDRSFGLAPEGSLMEAMLSSAIEMVGKTGQVLLVEGVETASRMAALKATGQVDVVQGYYISRPIDLDSLRSFLYESQFWSSSEAA